MESDEEEKRNLQKIENQNILSEDEIINSLDMKVYKDRIENIIGKQYSYLYFLYFENIYRSKIKNKISFPLTEYLNKDDNSNVTLWMHIYKSIKFYSKENLPIIIKKYFNLKAECEFKFLYNESKKYTNNPHKFLDIYIKKMKKANQKKLFEFKEKNPNMKIVFDLHKKQSVFVRSFLSRKTIIRPKLSFLKNQLNTFNQDEEEHSELSNKEEEIKNKKEMRLQIIKQIHQMKINSIKEVEKANILQNKQKKKYGGIKSRFLDAYNEQEKFFKIINSKSSGKITYTHLHNNKYSELEGTNLSSKRKINNSKTSSNTLLYLNTKENYSSRKNLKLNLFFSEEQKGLNNEPYKINSLKKNLKKNKFDYINLTKRFTPKNLKALNLFRIDNTNNQNNKKVLTAHNVNNKRKIKINKFKLKEFLDYKKMNSVTNYKNNKDIKKGFNLKKLETNNLIEKLNKQKNKEILDNLKIQKNQDEGYNNIIFNIFKRTEVY